MKDDKSAGARAISGRGWLAAAMVWIWVLWPACAVASDIFLGRADADASGGWPVGLWVRDGSRSHFIVRANRAELGSLPGRHWRPADARALMDLERSGAPRLAQRMDTDPCPVGLGWGQLLRLPDSGHGAGGGFDLQHAACKAASCALPAWRIELPPDAGDTLPLARLLPGLAARRAQWLVLHVVSPYEHVALAGFASLEVPEPLRNSVENRASRRAVLPLAAARQFPALQIAFLEHAAMAQGLGAASVLMRNDREGLVREQDFGQDRAWADPQARLHLLGLAGPSAPDLTVTRLLLRLAPADRPAVLKLQPNGRPQYEDLPMTLRALVPPSGNPASCRRQLAAFDCESGCAERVAEIGAGQPLDEGWPGNATIKTMSPGPRLAACRRACEQNKRRIEVGMQLEFDSLAERQRSAWEWVATPTGRPAADWQAR